jgi:hypothetical protein
VQHLREFGNFLSPRLGLFSNDTGRMVSAAINAMLPAILASLSLLLLIAFGWLVLARGVFAEGTGPLPPLGALTLGLITLLAFTVFEWRWRKSGEPWHPTGTLLAWLISLVVPVTVWGLVLWMGEPGSSLYPAVEAGGAAAGEAVLFTRLIPGGSGTALRYLWLFAPVLAWGAAIAVIVVGRTLASAAHPHAAAPVPSGGI